MCAYIWDVCASRPTVGVNQSMSVRHVVSQPAVSHTEDGEDGEDEQ